MTARPLPYEMGNAGDLLKHGWLAEWTRWKIESGAEEVHFLDPFGGRPWSDFPSTEVVRRVTELSDTAMARAQPTPKQKYFGSGHIVRNVALAMGKKALVSVSDREPAALTALKESGLSELRCPGFRASDSYSVLDSDAEGDLLHLDPFEDFVPQAAALLPKVARISTKMSVLIFVLINPVKGLGPAYRELRKEELPGALVGTCPRLPGSQVRGEGRYEVEVVLSLSDGYSLSSRQQLAGRLQSYCTRLGVVLGTQVLFESEST